MGRKRNYDEMTVLRELGVLFAASGYEATSIDQISKATGMKRGSIYQAFDNKANLFRISFSHALQSNTDRDLLADLVFIGLWERASIDPEVRSVAQQSIGLLEQEMGKTISEILVERLYERSGIRK